MTQNLLQKNATLKFSENVLDIIQFGSSVMTDEIYKDVDIAVIFKPTPIKVQLEEGQIIKKQLQKLIKFPIDISNFDLYSLFDESNFSREGILIYGKSLVTKKYFAERFGLSPKIHISYSLKGLKKKDKIRFHYLLKGRGGKYGLLRKYIGKLLKPGLIEIQPETESIFIKEIKKEITTFSVERMLLQKE